MTLSDAFDWVLIAAIVVLSLRRFIILVASVFPPRCFSGPASLPVVAILVPARNERKVATRLLGALAKLRYPPEKLSFVLICDGCRDGTPELFHAWASQRTDAQVLELPQHMGKARALNAGFEQTKAEIIVTVDADLAPIDDFLIALVQPFADYGVGAAAAYLRPVNANENIVSRYTALTSWVHQLVTSAGISRMGLNPPTLGAAAFRTSALKQIGGWPPAPLGEDIAASTSLIRRGWKTRFVQEAIANNTVESEIAGYWWQHVRWARATFHTIARDKTRSAASWPQRLESFISSIGYGDRLIFVIAAAGALVGMLPRWLPVLYLAVPSMEIVLAAFKAGAVSKLPHFLLSCVLLFPVDLAASITAVFAQAMHRQYHWRSLRSTPIDDVVNQ